MSIYVYNSTISTNTYVTEDYGSISSSVDASIDYSAGQSLPAQTQSSIDYSSYLYVSPTDFSSTSDTFDSAPNFDATSINFSSTETLDQAQTFDSAIYDNFGYVYDTSTIDAFGSLDLELTSGVVSESEVYVASGTLFSVGVLDENVTFAWVGNGTVFEIGNGLERTVKPYVASGTLRMDTSAAATALESVTWAYNPSSIYDPQLDWGSIAISVVGGDDFGLITQQPSGSSPFDDFGLVTGNPITYPQLPFGRFRFVNYNVDNAYDTCDNDGISCDNGSSANVSFTADTPDSTQLFDISGTAVESFSANTPEDTQLFSIFGELFHPFIDYTPHYGIEKNIGIGTTGIIFKSGVFPERFVFSYNENSPCYDSVAESTDFGLLTGTPLIAANLPNSDFLDYGLVAEEETGNIPDNFGWITEPLVTTCPFGSIYISGSLVEKNTESYVGIGTYNLSGTSVESFSAQTPEDVVLYNFFGTALESFSAQTPEDTQLFVISGSLIESETDSYVGLGTYNLSGTVIESFSGNTPEDTQLFSISGTAIESFSADTPDNTQLFVIAGSLVEKNTESYVGIGIVTLSGTSLESFSAQTPEDTQLFTISGTAVESFSAQTPEDTQLFSISGTAIESFSADTPDNTQLFTFSGSLVEKNTESYVGVGTLNLSGTAVESFSAQTPEDVILYTFSGSLVEKNTESYVGIGSFGPVPGVGFAPDGDGNLRDAKTYSNRYGFQIGDFNLGSGIGTIRINGIARTRLALPYQAQGSIFVSGQLNESFSKSNYNGSGIVTISGIASTREIAVYGYYGDDNNPGTSGTIFISQQTTPTIEKDIDSYLGSGQLSFTGISSVLIRNSYFGSGVLQLSGTGLEVFSAQTPENTQLFNISGRGFESYSAQTPETEVTYIIKGIVEESITNSYEGVGSATLSGNSSTFYVPNYPARGTFRFTRHDVDNDYDTCDSEEITCDNQNSADTSLTSNPPENTVLFNFDGSAITSEIAVYTNVGFGLYTLSGTYQSVKSVYSEVGIGTLFITEISPETETDVYVGSGSLFKLFGGSESYSAQTPESTIIFQISGSATTSLESDYPVVGIGLFSVSGSAITSEIATYTQIGSGTITLSGELVYPDVIYIPSPDGSGIVNIFGSSDNSLTKVYDGVAESLFTISSGLESFTKSTYIGIGTINIQELSGSTTNNPFQIPRTYVVII